MITRRHCLSAAVAALAAPMALLELVVNLKTACALGLVMPQELLLSAQQVIE